MPDVIADIEITPEIAKAVADLMVQAMMFDMDIDWENGTLTQKRVDAPEPFWKKRWMDKIHAADRQPGDYEGGSDGR
jgi:hypothetical protein